MAEEGFLSPWPPHCSTPSQSSRIFSFLTTRLSEDEEEEPSGWQLFQARRPPKSGKRGRARPRGLAPVRLASQESYTRGRARGKGGGGKEKGGTLLSAISSLCLCGSVRPASALPAGGERVPPLRVWVALRSLFGVVVGKHTKASQAGASAGSLALSLAHVPLPRSFVAPFLSPPPSLLGERPRKEERARALQIIMKSDG